MKVTHGMVIVVHDVVNVGGSLPATGVAELATVAVSIKDSLPKRIPILRQSRFTIRGVPAELPVFGCIQISYPFIEELLLGSSDM